MTFRKSGNINRGNKRSFDKSGKGSNPKGKSSFISKFSKKRSDQGKSQESPKESHSFKKKYFKSDKPGRQDQEGRERKSFKGSNQDKKPFDRIGSSRRSNHDKKPFDRTGSSRGSSQDKKPFGRTGSSISSSQDKKPFERTGLARSSNQDSPRPKKFISYKKKDFTKKTSDGLIRLNKFISNSGVCSRREADELIKMGLISVNGQVITEMGYKVKPTDDVRHERRRLQAEKPVYILLNKPKGFITTTDDPQERKTVMHLIGPTVKERIYPVGRLDRNTTGLLLLTNDGELAERLTHPSYKAKKIYRVELDKGLTKADFDKIVEGIRFEEGKAIVDDLAYVDNSKNIVGIELHIGWNRIVRRIFEALGYEVTKLDRVMYAGLDKKNIGRGEWRFLRQDEVTKLKHF